MQLVFVHGVATRVGPDETAYQQQVTERRGRFRDVCLEGTTVGFHDPYWGGEGTPAEKSFLSIPLGPGVPLALGGNGVGLSADERSKSSGTLLLTAARKDFDGLLNSLSIELIEEGTPEAKRLAMAIADYAVEHDEAAKNGQVPSWINDRSVETDEQLLARLREEIVLGPGGTTTLGLSDKLRAARNRVLGGAIGLVDGPIERLVRRLSPQVGIFLGDVFTYLREGTHRDAIREEVAASLVEAAKVARDGGEPLMVIGHSMGAIILHDMLTDTAMEAELASRIGAPLSINLLLTVGTQVGLFQELGLFDRNGIAAPTVRPPSAMRWWHVYNVMDVLSFGVDAVFGGVEQFSVNTQANIVDAHGAYFKSPIFHRRLRRRLQLAGLLA